MMKTIINSYRKEGKHKAYQLTVGTPEERLITLNKAVWISSKVEDIENCPDDLLNNIPVYNGLALYDECMLNFLELDKFLAQRSPEYNPVAHTYKKIEGVSIKKAVEFIYGKSGLELIERLLLDSSFRQTSRVTNIL